MILPIVFLLAALCGLAVLLGPGFLRLKNFSEEELAGGLAETGSFWAEFRGFFILPIAQIYGEKFRPKTYKEMEKMTCRFRIIVLRVECLLMRLSEYLRGKRIMSSNGHRSHYWEQFNSCKNGANNQENNTPG